MPCDAVYQTKVKLGIDTDIDIMKVALESEGYRCNIYGVGNTRTLSFRKAGLSGTMRADTGEITHDQRLPFSVNQAEKAYARALVNTQGEEKGWEVELVDGNKNHIKLHRRY